MFFAVAFLIWSSGAVMGYCLSSFRPRSSSNIETTETVSEGTRSIVQVSGTIWKLPERRATAHLYRDCGALSHCVNEPAPSKICDVCIKRAKKLA